jgi:hypothetical protein
LTIHLKVVRSRKFYDMLKNKPTLFFDFDGLKFDTLDIHIRYINQKYGIESVPDDYADNADLELVVKKYIPKDKHHLIDRADIYADIAENLTSSFEWHADLQPMEGMSEVLPLLVKKYAIWTVTAREKKSRPVIEHLLDIHVPDCSSGIHCVWEHLGGKEFKEISKREFILNFKGEKVAYVDDTVKEILKVQDIIRSYLFDRTGIHDANSNILNRVRSWYQLGEILL